MSAARVGLIVTALAAAISWALALASCVLPSSGASFRDFLVATPGPKASGIAATAPPGTALVITQTPPPGAGTPVPAATGAVASAGRLVLDADLNVGTPTFALQSAVQWAARSRSSRIQALPPGFSIARFQLSGSGGQTSRIGDLTVDPATGRGTALVRDLMPGTYSVLVVALESGGLVVASGTSSTVVPSGGAASASVRVESASKQRVRIDLPGGEIPAPSFSVSCGGTGRGSLGGRRA